MSECPTVPRLPRDSLNIHQLLITILVELRFFEDLIFIELLAGSVKSVLNEVCMNMYGRHISVIKLHYCRINPFLNFQLTGSCP